MHPTDLQLMVWHEQHGDRLRQAQRERLIDALRQPGPSIAIRNMRSLISMLWQQHGASRPQPSAAQCCPQPA